MDVGPYEHLIDILKKGNTLMPIFPELIDEKFPVNAKLSNGTPVLIRNIHADDTDLLWAFFKEIPIHDKLYLKEDLSEPEVAREWCQNLDYCSMLPVIALIEGKIVGYTLLQHETRTWQRHTGTVRMAVHPGYRGMGLAKLLLSHVVDMGMHCGLDRLQAEVMGEQKAAIRLFESFGFVKMAVVPKHVIDNNGTAHDYVLMVYPMRDVERHAAD